METFSASQKHQYKVILLGIEGSGKTTLLYHAKYAEAVKTIPTVGFNVETIEYEECSFIVWDMGGRKPIRALWSNYYEDIDAFIFVLDSNDENNIEITNQVFNDLLENSSLENLPILLFANKSDLKSLSVFQLAERFKLGYLRNRHWQVQPCSSITGEGIKEGFMWLNRILPAKPTFTLDDDEKYSDEEIEKPEDNLPILKLLMIGAHSVGKTTLLYKLKLGEIIESIPTVGFNLETFTYKDIKLCIWDIEGNPGANQLWIQYYTQIQGIIYVIDSSKNCNDNEQKQAFNFILSCERLKNIPILIIATKFASAVPDVERHIKACLGLDGFHERRWDIICVDAFSGKGLTEMLEWLRTNINRISQY